MRPNNEDAHGLTRQAAWINCNDYRMNALVSKFSTTDADSEIRTAMDIAENDGLTDAMPVPDVRLGEHLFLSTVISWRTICSILAHCVPEASHR